MLAADGLRARRPDHLHPAGTARGRAGYFALDDGDIIIRADHSGKLAAATRGAVVAFEADSLDPVCRSGWSVTVVGQSNEVTDVGEISRLEQMGLRTWVPGEHEHFIRISPGILNGRALSALTLS
jgi:uncharacterized protein